MREVTYTGPQAENMLRVDMAPAMTQRPQTMDQANVSALLEVMTKSLDNLSTLLTPERATHLSLENFNLAMQSVKSSQDTAWHIAKTVHLEGNTNHEMAKVHAGSGKHVQATKRSTKEKFVITGPVGSLSKETWEGLSEDRLKDLDDVLKEIVFLICTSGRGLGWADIGQVIHDELAKFGLQFAKSVELPTRKPDWARVHNKASSELSRILAMIDTNGSKEERHWYPYEMLLVLRRLMELRGFKLDSVFQ